MTKFKISFSIIFFVVITTQAQIVEVSVYEDTYVSVSPFKNGFAKIVENGKPYYINTKGEKLELIEPNSHNLGAEYAIVDYEKQIFENPEYLPKTVVNYHNENGHGILSPKGEILLDAGYDFIDTQFRTFWKVGKEGKISMFLPDRTLLPYFDEIGYLDGEYFDVKRDEEWHLYSKSQNKIVTKNKYDGFDYCGGCGSSSKYLYAQKDGKWGIIDWNEELLVPFEYEHTHHRMRNDNWITSFSRNGQSVIVNIPTQKEFYNGELLMGLLIVKENGKYGIYGSYGELKIPFEYDKIELPNENSYLGYYGNYLIVTKQNKRGIIDLEGIQILPPEYEDIKIYDDYFVVKKNKVSYLLDITLRVLTSVENGEILHVNDYFYSSGSKGIEVFKIKKRAYYGLIFAKTKKEVPPEFYDIQQFHFQNGDLGKEYIIGEKNGLLALFNEEGVRLLEDCQKINDFYNAPEGFVSFTKDGKTGIYDLKKQKEILPATYDNYDIWSSGDEKFIKASVSEKPEDPYSAAYLNYHLYGMNGKRLVEWDLEKVDSLSSDRILLKIKGEGMGYVLFNTKSLQTEKLDYLEVYIINSPQLLVVSDDSITGRLYDIELKNELKGAYDLHWLKHGYLPEKHGKELIIFPFKNGMALVYNEHGYGYINEKGKQVVKPQYDWAFDFIGEAAMVCMSDSGNNYDYNFKMGFIDKKGKTIFPMEYDLDNANLNHEESFFTANAVKLSRQKNYQYLYGLGDLRTGKQLLPIKYTQIRNIDNGAYLLLQEEHKMGISDNKGNIVVPIEYDDIMFQTSTYYNWKSNTEESIFPLLVYNAGKWRYINIDGTYLPVVGNYTRVY